MTQHYAVERSIALLKWAYGLTLIAIGIDKVFQINFFAEWQLYVSPFAQSLIPLSPTAVTVSLGIAEIVVGLMFLTRFARAAAYLTIAVLAVIIVNLGSMGLYDIAARDFLIALGALVLVWLISARRI